MLCALAACRACLAAVTVTLRVVILGAVTLGAVIKAVAAVVRVVAPLAAVVWFWAVGVPESASACDTCGAAMSALAIATAGAALPACCATFPTCVGVA